MQSTQTLSTQQTYSYPLAAAVPKLDHKEAARLAKTELAKFIALIESLDETDWDRPTMCTKWNVRDILAHQAGAYSSAASFAEFRRQVIGNPYMKEEKMPIDAINRRQLADRAGRSADTLLAELRSSGPKAIANRQKLPGILRALPVIDFGPPVGRGSIGYLTDDIYLRDTWSHRLDICAAIGRDMTLTQEHDGRITALIVRDLEKILRPYTKNSAFVIDIKGTAGGIWQIGAQQPEATISIETLDFHILASGRATAEQMIAAEKVTFDGNTAFAKRIFSQIAVLY